MVGPVSEDERSSFARRLKAVIVGVVGLSAGLMALSGDASLRFIAVAVLAGLALGALLVWIVFPGHGGVAPPRE